MALELKAALVRARATLVEDAAGVVSLAAILIVSLHLPSFF
ncbi:MAG: hypothetical protein ACK4NE_02820 [Albidovulum sp.]